MKVVILHGDNAIESYKRLQKFIDSANLRGWGIQRIFDSSQDISEMIVSEALFQVKRLVIVDNASLVTKKNIAWLEKKADNLDITLVIYHSTTLPKTFINSLPKEVMVEEFKFPKLIWSFLGAFYPGNVKKILELLHQIIKNEPIEFVFHLLARQLRDLYWVKVDLASLPYPSWRISKLKSQANKFSKGLLKEFINDLARADIDAKTSKTQLIDSLDFLIVTKLE